MDDFYVSPVYEPNAAVNAFHAVPRFGNLDDITKIFSSDVGILQEEAISYILGTIFIASFLLASYITFLILVLIFKCCCKNKFPILAGKPFVEERKHEGAVGSKIIRAFVLVCSIVAIVSGILFLIEGEASIMNTTADIHDGLDGVLSLTGELGSTADSFIQVGEESSNLSESIVNTISNGICTLKDLPLPDEEKTEFENGLQAIDDAAEEVVDILASLNEYARSEITQITDTFTTSVNDLVLDIGETTDQVTDQLNFAYYAGPAIAFGSVILVGIILAWYHIDINVYFIIQTWFILPLLFIFITLTLITIACVATALVANSDICIGNPSGTPEGFVESLSDELFGDGIGSVLDYYIVDGCKGQYDLLNEVESVLDSAREAISSREVLTETLENVFNRTYFETLCEEGAAPVDQLKSDLNATISVFDSLLVAGESAIDLLACENINRIWVDIMHDAFCTSVPTALAWMFSTMTAIYVFGIFTFIFRGAILPASLLDNYRDMSEDAIRKVEEEEYNDKWGLMEKKVDDDHVHKDIEYTLTNVTSPSSKTMSSEC